MDRLATGRRHIRAGSVHVSELIGRRPRPVGDLGAVPPGGELHLDGSTSGDDNGDINRDINRDTNRRTNRTTAAMLNLLAAQVHPPGSHRRRPSTAAHVAKIAGLALASVALCIAVAVASSITHQRRAEVARPAMDISGEQALLPDRLNSAVPKGGMTGRPELPGARHATGAIENTGSAPTPAAPAAPGAPGPSSSEPFDPITKTELVRRFYELAPAAPEQAFSLLDGILLGTDLGEFARSWSLVRDVQVLDIHEHGEDVQATVRLRLADGSYLRMEQLLDVADTLPRRIVDAKILSAQRD